MEIIKTPIKDLVVIKPRVFADARGFFLVHGKKHLYVFCRYTKLFDPIIYKWLENEFARFEQRRKTIAGLSEIAELSKEWDYERNGELLPQHVSYGMGKKVGWICPRGHKYEATILHRSSGTNCPICNSGRQTSFAEQAIFYYIKNFFIVTFVFYKNKRYYYRRSSNERFVTFYIV